MRWLIIQEESRRKETAFLRERRCMSRALERTGNEAQCFGINSDGFEKRVRWCDAILFLENYDTRRWTPDLSRVRKPKIFWSIDGHCAFSLHEELVRRNRFDIILNSCVNCVNEMLRYTPMSLWFPNCYPSDRISPEGAVRTVPIGYCGSMGNAERTTMINRLQSHVGMQTDIMVLGMQMIRALRSYSISFNYNISHDINYRTFESMGAGAMLLTNRSPGMSDLFTDKEHLVFYDDFDDCVSKARYYIDHDEERKRIAAAGHDLVRRLHTYDSRAKRLCAMAREVA